MCDAQPGGPDLLSRAEHAVFHSPPDQALAVLQRARAGSDARTRLGVRWLTGVTLGSLGRYGQALAELEPLLTASAPGAPVATGQERLFAGCAAATTASLLRQVGDHAGGQRLDSWGLRVLTGLDRWTGPAGDAADAADVADPGDAADVADAADIADAADVADADDIAEAAADCAIGLAAEAVGLGDAARAQRRLREVAHRVSRCEAQRWRVRVRQGWVVAEVALLTGRPLDALIASRRSLLASERAGAPRHVAKSLLFLGVAQLEVATDGGSAAALEFLRRAAMLAEGLGLLPLIWPARAVLARALAAGAAGAATGAAGREAQENLDAARAAVVGIAAGLPPRQRDAWLCRPDMEALFA